MEPLNDERQVIEKEFLISNGINTKNHNHNNQNPPKDIEMITIQPNSYTSLRDIIAVQSVALAVAGRDTPPAPSSPSSAKSSWEDVPIKNPLLKQAALAYLQPMSTANEIDDRSWVDRMKANLNRCFAGEDDDGVEVGCMGVLDGVVLAPIREVSGRIWRVFKMIKRKGDHED